MGSSTLPPAIVLIEKDEITLELYQRELRKSFTVLPFTDTRDVLATIAQREVQAVVIEPEIHAGQGWALIQAIRAEFPDRALPVVVCSTRDTGPASAAGPAARYLTKPVLPHRLRKVILEVLGLPDAMRGAA